MKKKLTLTESLTLSSMLFGLFFGAGNLIFPAYMGHLAGKNVVIAWLGFLITGVGLPLLAIAALGISRSEGVLALSEKAGRRYGYFFTCLLYLTIGPFFAIPRCFTVPFETGIKQLLPTAVSKQTALLIFSLVFFAIMLWFSLKPGRIMDWIGKILTPAFLVFFFLLMITALIKPIAPASSAAAMGTYTNHAFTTGMIEGYNTLDALAGLAFGIIVVSAIRTFGISEPAQVAKAAIKTGLLAGLLMVIIYGVTSLVGAQSRTILGNATNGGDVLNAISVHYFPGFGSLLFTIIVMIACLKTAIGLVTSSAEAFNQMFPKTLNYNYWAILFSTVALLIANLGLDAIISISVPVLRLLYPLAIALILTALSANIFHFGKLAYAWMSAIAMICAIGDFLTALPSNLQVSVTGLINLYAKVLPFFKEGLGWFLPTLITFVCLIVYYHFKKQSKAN